MSSIQAYQTFHLLSQQRKLMMQLKKSLRSTQRNRTAPIKARRKTFNTRNTRKSSFWTPPLPQTKLWTSPTSPQTQSHTIKQKLRKATTATKNRSRSRDKTSTKNYYKETPKHSKWRKHRNSKWNHLRPLKRQHRKITQNNSKRRKYPAQQALLSIKLLHPRPTQTQSRTSTRRT